MRPDLRTTDGELATALGLDIWHVGNRELRCRSQRDVLGRVDYLWRFDVLPSFGPSWVIAVAGGVAPDSNGELFRRAAWALGKEVEIANVVDDRLGEVLNSVQLFNAEPSRYGTLDGTAYQLALMTWHLQTTVSFSNPDQEQLVHLVYAALQVARQIAFVSNNAILQRCLRPWQEKGN